LNLKIHLQSSIVKLDKCKLELPIDSYLIPNGKNNQIYFGKIADELIRFKRVRSFIMEPKIYLNISNVNYKTNPDEILLLDSSINSVYLNESNIFNVNDYMKNIKQRTKKILICY